MSGLTFAEFEQLPGVLVGRQELLNGELIATPVRELSHTQTAQEFFDHLQPILGRRVYMGAGYLMGENWLQPDVSVTWPRQPQERGYLAGAPMIAGEIISENKFLEQIEDRAETYLVHGGREVWVISRRKRTITVYTQKGGVIVSARVTTEYRPEGIDLTIRPAELIVS